MKDFIEKTIQEIQAKGDALASDLSGKINGLKWTVKPPVQEDNDNRNTIEKSKKLYIAGSVLAAASGVSLIAGFGLRPLSYIGLFGGIGLCIFSYMKLHGNANTAVVKEPKIDIQEVKNFFADRIFSYLDAANKDWNVFIEGIKTKVQEKINSSSLDDDKKSAAMFYTYVTESMTLNTSSLLSGYNACNTLDEVMRLKSTFADTVTAKIRETVKAQTDKYNSITA